MKIAIIANTAWYLHNFRLNLALALNRHGHEVVFISPADRYVSALNSAGFKHLVWELNASGTHPWREFKSIRGLGALLRTEGIQAVFSYTPKANIYSGISLPKNCGIFIPNVSGLGRVFIHKNWITPVVKVLYRLAFQKARCVVFQNDDDCNIFHSLKLVQQERSVRVPGSGVDLKRFSPTPFTTPPTGNITTFLFIGRLLRDKGAREFAHAARMLRKEGQHVRCVMLGSTTSENPAAIGHQELNTWLEAGDVEHIEHCDDVRPWIAQADCIVLPSYREGVPRCLLEAAAMARPLIASDAPGCRDAVRHGLTGYLCETRSVDSLSNAMRSFLNLSTEEKRAMGLNGRHFVEINFDERSVIEQYLHFVSNAELSHPCSEK